MGEWDGYTYIHRWQERQTYNVTRIHTPQPVSVQHVEKERKSRVEKAEEGDLTGGYYSSIYSFFIL